MTHAEQLRNHWYWRPGWRVGRRGYYWHLTWDGHAELHRLVDAYQAVLARFPGLDPIPRPWLHMTLQGVGFADVVTDDQLAALTDRARAALAGVGPIKVRFDRVLVWSEAVVLAPTSAEPLESLRAKLRELTGAVTGETPGRDDFSPHVSFAYVNADQPATEVVAAVESLRPEPAEVVIDAVTLLEQHRDHGMYEWKAVSTLPLT